MSRIKSFSLAKAAAYGVGTTYGSWLRVPSDARAIYLKATATFAAGGGTIAIETTDDPTNATPAKSTLDTHDFLAGTATFLGTAKADFLGWARLKVVATGAGSAVTVDAQYETLGPFPSTRLFDLAPKTTAVDAYTPPASLVAWYRGDDVVGADGALVASWPDNSGNGIAAVQAVGGNKPTLKLAIVGTHAVVRFTNLDGSGAQKFLTLDSSALADHHLGTIVAVVGNRVVGGGEMDLIANPYPNATKGGLRFFPSAHELHSDANSLLGASTDKVIDGTQHVGAADVDFGGTGATFHLFVERVTGAGAPFNGDGTYSIGSGSADATNKLDLAELLIFAAVLSDTDMRTVERYLAAKYAITTADDAAPFASGWRKVPDEALAFYAVLKADAAAAGGTVDVKLQLADDALGTNSVDVTGGAFTQVTDAAAAREIKGPFTNFKQSYVRVSVALTGFSEAAAEAYVYGVRIVAR